ncbi:MAG: phosphoglycerate kinase [Candidatus Aenigmatarchaeota archaeon]
MIKEFFLMNDFDLKNKTVAIRVDLNTDFIESRAIKNERFERHAKTIKELIENNAKIIIIAHQGRKGDPDFFPLEQHAKILSEEVGYEIKFVNDLIGEEAKKAIENLKNGEAILLDNVRKLDDEDKNKSIDEHTNSSLVKFLKQYIDFYILDAFSVAHRAHSSIVGFAKVKPMIAGRVMESEIESVKNALKSLGLNVWVVGGAKIDDIINVLESVFENKPESIDRVLTGGLLANLFLFVNGYEIGSKSLEILKSKFQQELFERAKNLLNKYKKEIILPIDVAIEENGKRKEVKIENIPKDALILDIGRKTIKTYKDILNGARSVIVKGPIGMFERKGFEKGTKEILKHIANLDAFSLIGGGDTSVAIKELKIKGKFGYISVGGGALLTFLSGKPMPGIEALKVSYSFFSQKL